MNRSTPGITPLRQRMLEDMHRSAAGIAVVALSLPRGRRSDKHYGSWDRLVL